MIDRFEVSTAQLPAELDDLQRFLHWRNAAEGPAGAIDMSPTPDRPFKSRSAGFRSGMTSTWRIDGTIKQIGSARNVLSYIGSDRLVLNSNLGCTSMAIARNGTDVVFEACDAVDRSAPDYVPEGLRKQALRVPESSKHQASVLGEGADAVPALVKVLEEWGVLS